MFSHFIPFFDVIILILSRFRRFRRYLFFENKDIHIFILPCF